jgi:hypothetical protein
VLDNRLAGINSGLAAVHAPLRLNKIKALEATLAVAKKQLRLDS